MPLLYALLFAAQIAGANEPLQPIGKWQVSPETNACLLTRDFGTADQPVTFALKPPMLAEKTDVILLQNASADDARSGPAKIVVTPGPTIETHAHSDRIKGAARTMTVIYVDTQQLKALADATRIEFQMNNRHRLALSPRGIGAGMKALQACLRDLASKQGIDPDEYDRVAAQPRPEGLPFAWLGPDDFSRATPRGTVQVLLTIAPSGRVEQCAILNSSGSKVLDDAPCAAALKKGRFKPGRDSEGKPVKSWYSVPVTFEPR